MNKFDYVINFQTKIAITSVKNDNAYLNMS